MDVCGWMEAAQDAAATCAQMIHLHHHIAAGDGDNKPEKHLLLLIGLMRVVGSF